MGGYLDKVGQKENLILMADDYRWLERINRQMEADAIRERSRQQKHINQSLDGRTASRGSGGGITRKLIWGFIILMVLAALAE